MGREKRVASRIRTLEQLFQIQCFSHPTFGILIGRVTENAYLAAFSEVSNLSKVARVGPFGVHGYGFRMGWEKRVASRARNGAVCFFNSSFFSSSTQSRVWAKRVPGLASFTAHLCYSYSSASWLRSQLNSYRVPCGHRGRISARNLRPTEIRPRVILISFGPAAVLNSLKCPWVLPTFR